MLIPLGEVASIRAATVFREQAPKPSPFGNVHGLTIKDLVAGWPIKPSNSSLIEVDESLLSSCLVGGEVLVPSRGDYYPARYFRGSEERIFPYGQINLIIPSKNIISGYLAWCLNQPYVQNQIADLRTGTSIQALTRPNLMAVMIAVPPIEVQQSISKIQDLWSESKELNARLMELQGQEIEAICRIMLISHSK